MIDYINERNARTSKRADAAVNVLAAVILGLFMALALAHWLGWLL